MGNSQQKPGDTFKINGNWADQSRDLKSQFSQLTDEDLKVEQGKENEMIGRVESRLGKNREEVINIIQNGEKNQKRQKDQKELKNPQRNQDKKNQQNQQDLHNAK